MVELTRTVRFALEADGTLAAEAPLANSFAAWPPMQGLGRYYELHVTCRGAVDPRTGYFINIKVIDQAVRRRVLPVISAAAVEGRDRQLGRLMQQAVDVLRQPLGEALHSVTLQLTPRHTVAMEVRAMTDALVTQRYEFSAAHRLHVPALSDAENRELFGKCNNPAGHGHNYILEVAIRCPLCDDGSLALDPLDALVKREVIDPFDHKNLDVDVPQLVAANSSVENIARVIFDMLREPVQRMDVELAHVRVWETGKTSCTYPAP